MPDILLPVYDRHATSLVDEADYATLEAILTEPSDFDAHFSAYSVPEFPYRLKKEALKNTAVPMVLLVFDVDDPVAHEQDVPARPEWYALERTKISNLLMRHDAFVYHTRGGYRVVAGWLPEPFVVSTQEDAETWRAFYLTHVHALKRRFGIEADSRCADWQRQFRSPRACRDGVVQDLPTYGDPGSVGTYGDEHLTDEDVVEPARPRENHAREGMRTDPPIEERERMAREHVARLPGSVQGAGAEDTLWAACNVALVGYDLDTEAAARVIRDSHIPNSDLSKHGEEHFYRRMWKKLDELDANGGSAPFGHLIEAKKMARAEIFQGSKLTPVKVDTQRQDSAQEKHTRAIDRIKLRPVAELLRDSFDPTVQRLPTPFKTLNEITRGGFRQKDFVIVCGKPGAGKTSFCVQLAAHYLEQGIPVAFDAADESLEFLLSRLGQRKGLSRDDIEEGKPHAIERLEELCSAWKLLPVSSEWDGATLENIMAALHEQWGPGVLITDSIQRVRTDTSGSADSKKAQVDDVVETIKQGCELFKHIVIATSEVVRANYANKNDLDNVEDIAAGKESGGIEYGCKVILVLKDTKEEDVFTVSTAKNRAGRGKPKWRMRWDYVRATFTELDKVTEEDEAKKEAQAFQAACAQVQAHIKDCNGSGKKLTSRNQVLLSMQQVGKGMSRALFGQVMITLEAESRIGKGMGHYEVLV